MTHPFETKNVGLDEKELELNGAFVRLWSLSFSVHVLLFL